jgi:hypothetical protein
MDFSVSVIDLPRISLCCTLHISGSFLYRSANIFSLVLVLVLVFCFFCVCVKFGSYEHRYVIKNSIFKMLNE